MNLSEDQPRNASELAQALKYVLNETSLKAQQLHEVLNMMTWDEASGRIETKEERLSRQRLMIGAAVTLAAELYTSADKCIDELDAAERKFGRR